jgi:WD40 repeat protein
MSVAFSADGRRIVTGSGDQSAKVWDARTGTPLLELKGETGVVMSVAFSADGRRIVTGSDDRTAKVWDARTGTPLLELKGHTDFVTSVAFIWGVFTCAVFYAVVVMVGGLLQSTETDQSKTASLIPKRYSKQSESNLNFTVSEKASANDFQIELTE